MTMQSPASVLVYRDACDTLARRAKQPPMSCLSVSATVENRRSHICSKLDVKGHNKLQSAIEHKSVL